MKMASSESAPFLTLLRMLALALLPDAFRAFLLFGLEKALVQ